MKRLICFLLIFMFFIPSAINEDVRKELPPGFYDSEVVQEAIERQIAQFREFTPAQLEVIYLASKQLHDLYFGPETPDGVEIKEMRLPQGEYVIGELIPSGNYRFSLLDNKYDVVVLWIEKRSGSVGNYYSMTTEKPEVILHLEDGWTLRVTYEDILVSEITTL